jgi:hypothetical protein
MKKPTEERFQCCFQFTRREEGQEVMDLIAQAQEMLERELMKKHGIYSRVGKPSVVLAAMREYIKSRRSKNAK